MGIFKKKWIRIGNLGICCPICGKSDWCRVSKNGEYILCSRIPEYKQEGTLHKADKSIETEGISDIASYYPAINWYALNKSYVSNCPLWRINQFGVLKGISPRSLIRLNMGFDGEAYTFPIYNEDCCIVGVQRQFPDKGKLMIKGSKLGVFIPTTYSDKISPLVITEGISDCGVALDLEFNAIGRLNCCSGLEIIRNLANKSHFDSYIIISDNDEHKAGQNGAYKLGGYLKHLKVKIKVVIPPAQYKDLRNWKRKTDLNREQFNNICEELPVI